MPQEKTLLQKRIESGKPIIIAEISPPKAADAARVRSLAKSYAGKVHALGVSDNREGVSMSALVSASLILAGNVEPILHVSTRDRNRTALISDCLGAHALGIRNILCTSGTHQALSPYHSAKSVFDIDATILLQTCKSLDTSAALIGEDKIAGPLHFCLGGVASPFADPLELQLTRCAQKIFVGAEFLITQPVFDLERFGLWWNEITARGLQEKTAFIAGVKVLTDAQSAKAFAEKRPLPLVPGAIIERLASKSGSGGAKEGIAIAGEIIEKLSACKGLRGFEIVCDDHEAGIEVLNLLKSKLG